MVDRKLPTKFGLDPCKPEFTDRQTDDGRLRNDSMELC